MRELHPEGAKRPKDLRSEILRFAQNDNTANSILLRKYI